MFWNKGTAAKPLNIPIDDLLVMLAPTSIKARRDGNSIIADHGRYLTRIEVLPPENTQAPGGQIKAVIRVKSQLPEPLRKVLGSHEGAEFANKFGALGALTLGRGEIYIGSRLTIYESPDVWAKLDLPLLMFSVICGAEAVLGALRRSMQKEEDRGGESLWTEADMKSVERHMERLCVCSNGGLGFTAEFSLGEGAGSAIAGDNTTALFQLMADQPHPELGGGLFCLTQMPHRISDEQKLYRVCEQLNTMEMAAQDLPPHFGAWCVGKLGSNPAYVSFLPNPFHSVAGIAVNVAHWAMHRAEWANAKLAEMGEGV